MLNRQTELVLQTYVQHKDEIDSAIIEIANHQTSAKLSSADEWEEYSIPRDGLFDAWIETSQEYADYVSEYGNDGEEEIISVICRAVLARENAVKYREIIEELARIEREGL